MGLVRTVGECHLSHAGNRINFLPIRYVLLVGYIGYLAEYGS